MKCIVISIMYLSHDTLIPLQFSILHLIGMCVIRMVPLLGGVPENLFSLMIVNGNDNCLTGIVLAKISLNGIQSASVRGLNGV